MASKPRMIVLSAVLPFPGTSGQQQRVFYTLKALRQHFTLTFLSRADSNRIHSIRKKLLELCDETLLLPSRYSRTLLSKICHRVFGSLYVATTGLKFSNYLVGNLELAPKRIAPLLLDKQFDCALFEYWHAYKCVDAFRSRHIPCILDMHNILWRSYLRQLASSTSLPRFWKTWALERYRTQETEAWQRFDGIIAINAEERKYVHSVIGNNSTIFYAPMGIDLAFWPYSWQPSSPPRIAYYGGLGSSHNQKDALKCYEQIMPIIWKEYPDAELWLIGSNPPEFIKDLSSDPRVTVTGYVEHVQDVLKEVAVLVCPWSGTYGFRSRVIEVMALGVPVVATPEAVYGMGLDPEEGILIEETSESIAQACMNLLRNPGFAKQQSRLARTQVQKKFSYEETYDKLAKGLIEFLKSKNGEASMKRGLGGIGK